METVKRIQSKNELVDLDKIKYLCEETFLSPNLGAALD